MTEWIKTKDAVPNDADNVLVCCKLKNGNLSVKLGYYVKGTKSWVCGMNSNVIMWMPIPELPKEDEE